MELFQLDAALWRMRVTRPASAISKMLYNVLLALPCLKRSSRSLYAQAVSWEFLSNNRITYTGDKGGR